VPEDADDVVHRLGDPRADLRATIDVADHDQGS
jgi:hypothetical protein